MPRTASLTQIEAKIRELQKKAEALKQRQKPGIQQLRAVIAKYHLTAEDIKVAVTAAGSRGRPVRSPLRGKKLKPRYRNPANRSETWAGRGLKPKWLTELLKRGKKLDDLAIK